MPGHRLPESVKTLVTQNPSNPGNDLQFRLILICQRYHIRDGFPEVLTHSTDDNNPLEIPSGRVEEIGNIVSGGTATGSSTKVMPPTDNSPNQSVIVEKTTIFVTSRTDRPHDVYNLYRTELPASMDNPTLLLKAYPMNDAEAILRYSSLRPTYQNARASYPVRMK